MGLISSLVGAISPAEASRDAAGWLAESMVSGPRTTAGVNVTPTSAITLSAVFASARAIAEDVGCMPLKVYRRLDGGGKESARDEPTWFSPELMGQVNTYTLLHDRPNADMDDMTFRAALIWLALLYGNAYAEIEWSQAGQPTSLHLRHPLLVTADRDELGLFYRVREKDGRERIIRAYQMVHIKGIAEDGVVGLMMLQYARESLGVYMAAERFTGAFFGNGATLAGVITMDQAFKDQESRKLWIDGFNRVYSGARNSNKWAMIDGPGAKVQAISSDPEKSQLVETLKFRIEDVARWFRVPPVMIGHNTATPYSNVESLFRVYHSTGLKPWALRIEKETTIKLLSGKPDLFAEHVVDSLMWADAKTRAEVHAIRIRSGQATPNEARDIENLNPYEGGDRFRVEQNLSLIDEDGRPEQVNASPSAPATTDTDAIKLAAMPIFVDAAERMIVRESKAFAAKRNPDADWIDKFYAGQRGEVANAFIAPIATLARLLNKSAEGLSERYADMHVGESRRRLQEGEDPAAWLTDRPAWIARFLTDEVSNG